MSKVILKPIFIHSSDKRVHKFIPKQIFETSIVAWQKKNKHFRLGSQIGGLAAFGSVAFIP